MDPSTLTTRLRGILRPQSRSRAPEALPAEPLTEPADQAEEQSRAEEADALGLPNMRAEPDAPAAASLESALGGAWRQFDGRNVFLVEQRRAPSTLYGRVPVGALAESLAARTSEGPLLAGGAPVQPPFVFFDLETTGLAGGAGTQAFLVGCGAFDEAGGFVTRQFVLTRPMDERALLEMLAAELAPAGALVTFNGKSFDAPLIETRHLFHRLEWTGARLPHLDVLHAARRFWGEAAGGSSPCSLGALEDMILGARRRGDVPGFEIPARYFHFVRTGDARPLAAVLEHNRLDLLSLAGLTARLFDLVRLGPDAVHHAREAVALGRVYARGGLVARARDAYERAVAMGSLSMDGLVDARRSLALLLRRARHYDAAAACWRVLLDLPGVPPAVAREASEALAIHHEHRARDLRAARRYALRNVNMLEGSQAAWEQAARHRLARITRKMAAIEQPALFPSSPLPPSCGSRTSGRRTSS